ncbi:MAG: O-antigen ligase family protein [Ignavibacteria bacterium]
MKISNKNIYSQIALITFFLYFFFTLFGTSLPFRTGTRDPSELGTSNVVNQIVFTTLFLTALFSLIPKMDEVTAIIKREKFLIIFLIWCTLTLFWTGNSFVVFKRLFQFYTVIIVCLAFLANSDSADNALFILKIFFSVFMIVSLISIFTIPGAISRHYREWQGLATSKNGLGQASLVSTVIWIYVLSKEKRIKSQLFAIFMLIISLILLFGSNSITSISAFLFLVIVWLLFEMDKIFKPLGIRRTITIIFLVFAGLIILLDLLYSGALMASVFALAGKNLTLTGRTDLWADILLEVKKHLLIGCGYKGFWIVDSPKILEVYETYVWLPRSSHSGYIDILNETGLIGLLMVIGIIINYFVTLVKHKKRSFWMWFIVIALIENFTETIFFNAGGLMTLLFVFAYISLFSEIINKERNIAEQEIGINYQI